MFIKFILGPQIHFRSQKHEIVGKSMFRSVNLIKLEFMRLTLLHIYLPTLKSDPEPQRNLITRFARPLTSIIFDDQKSSVSYSGKFDVQIGSGRSGISQEGLLSKINQSKHLNFQKAFNRVALKNHNSGLTISNRTTNIFQ